MSNIILASQRDLNGLCDKPPSPSVRVGNKRTNEQTDKQKDITIA